MFLLILVVVCYTICSLSDKYAVSTAKFNGDELGFLMAAATAVFMACCLPFLDRTITLSWQSFAAIGLLCLSKILEFKLSAIILDEISAFELKAWLGITLFMSYATDIFLGEKPSVFKFLFIVLTVAGLVFIAKSGRTDSGNINYRRIVVPLVFYLLARYGYGIVVRASENVLCAYTYGYHTSAKGEASGDIQEKSKGCMGGCAYKDSECGRSACGERCYCCESCECVIYPAYDTVFAVCYSAHKKRAYHKAEIYRQRYLYGGHNRISNMLKNKTSDVFKFVRRFVV